MLYIVLLVVYLLFLLGFYFFVMKRLKGLSQKHKKHTGIAVLGNGYLILRRRLIPLLLILYGCGALVIITIFKDGILY